VVPPAFIIPPLLSGEGWGEVSHGNNLGLHCNGSIPALLRSLKLPQSQETLHSKNPCENEGEGDFAVRLTTSHRPAAF
jgi:hypothetical protein